MDKDWNAIRERYTDMIGRERGFTDRRVSPPMSSFDTEDVAVDVRNRIIKSAVTPRPIAWISTRSADGEDNLAPFSSYNYISSRQPLLLFNSTYRDDGELKDTPRNVLDTEEFVVNVVTEPLADKMDLTSAPLPHGESEFDHADVERAESTRVSAPRVADAVVSMECELHDTYNVYERIMIMGDVVRFHVSDDVQTDGKIDMEKFKTVGRLGGPFYTLGDRMELTRRY